MPCCPASLAQHPFSYFYVERLAEKNVALATYSSHHRPSSSPTAPLCGSSAMTAGRSFSIRALSPTETERSWQIVDHVCYPHSMRALPPSLLLAACLVSATHCSATAQNPSSTVEVRLATQNALFEEVYQTDLKNAPERATAYRRLSLQRSAIRPLPGLPRAPPTTEDVAFLSRLKAIPTTGFSEQDILSHDLLVRVLQQRLPTTTSKSTRCPSTR